MYIISYSLKYILSRIVHTALCLHVNMIIVYCVIVIQCDAQERENTFRESVNNALKQLMDSQDNDLSFHTHQVHSSDLLIN